MKLTLFIFCYERPYYLERQLEIFNKLNLNAYVYILDGSENISKKKYIKNLSKIYNCNYFHEVSYNSRVLFIKNILKTEYYAYCSDDDVVDPNYYIQAINFLEKNKDYSAVSGKTISLQYKKKFPFLGFRLVHHLTHKYDTTSNNFIEKWKIIDEAYLIGSPPIYYAVKRKECYFKLEGYVKYLKFAVFIEQLDKITTLLTGKIKTLDVFMCLRDYSAGSIIYEEREPVENLSFKEDEEILSKVINENFDDENYKKKASELILQSYKKKTKNNDKILRFKGNILKIIYNIFLNYFLNVAPFGINHKFYKVFKKCHIKLAKKFNRSF